MNLLGPLGEYNAQLLAYDSDETGHVGAPDPIPWPTVLWGALRTGAVELARSALLVTLQNEAVRGLSSRRAWGLCRDIPEYLRDQAQGSALFWQYLCRDGASVRQTYAAVVESHLLFSAADAAVGLALDCARHAWALVFGSGAREVKLDDEGRPVAPPLSLVPGQWQFLAARAAFAGLRVSLGLGVSGIVTVCAVSAAPPRYAGVAAMGGLIAGDIAGSLACSVAASLVSL